MKQNILKEIWILDDDSSVLEVIEAILQEYGYKTRRFMDELELRRALDLQFPALLFIDVLLNDSDGRDIALSLKSHERSAYIPIILMSANSRFLEESGKIKSDDILHKPFELEDLLSKVRKYVK